VHPDPAHALFLMVSLISLFRRMPRWSERLLLCYTPFLIAVQYLYQIAVLTVAIDGSSGSGDNSDSGAGEGRGSWGRIGQATAATMDWIGLRTPLLVWPYVLLCCLLSFQRLTRLWLHQHQQLELFEQEQRQPYSPSRPSSVLSDPGSSQSARLTAPVLDQSKSQYDREKEEEADEKIILGWLLGPLQRRLNLPLLLPSSSLSSSSSAPLSLVSPSPTFTFLLTTLSRLSHSLYHLLHHLYHGQSLEIIYLLLLVAAFLKKDLSACIDVCVLGAMLLMKTSLVRRLWPALTYYMLVMFVIKWLAWLFPPPSLRPYLDHTPWQTMEHEQKRWLMIEPQGAWVGEFLGLFALRSNNASFGKLRQWLLFCFRPLPHHPLHRALV